ncbi:outer membrane protein assembly factor BamD [Roseomonas sp. NAR14]|uniref:Outer membrane protein assembly factor BamD n=1 Tax=Roseomonas acroporae TaxID=2937791 RepID=A0A9X1Y4P4_9PROT|nr:outer membrane protein assembly factor BamD [Roseomonas acroporae]MCK8783097.1 outer membrane protein assembly factor BamD [Roseomonas acroporae]
MKRTPQRLVLPLLLLALTPGCETLREWRGDTTRPTSREAMRDRSPESLYADGIDALQAKRYQQAVDLFDTIEREHPYSTWATNATLMGAYADYQRNRYTEAIGALDRFIQLHPAHRDIAYAYYLRALSQYEQISDAQRDQRATEQAIAALQDVVNRFPDSAYARDARLKIDLGRDHLAGKEMVIGRFYERQRLYGAAINRFRRVVDDYQTTNHTPEALFRLVESYTALGMTDEARRTAAVLGSNFPGSPWYQDAYALLTPGAPRAAQDRPGFVRRAWNWVF